MDEQGLAAHFTQTI